MEDGFDDGGDDALLLREFAHRTGNVLAVAVAAVELASRAGRTDGGRVLAEAGGRLRLLGGMHRLLARPVPPIADVAADLESLCSSMHAARPGPAGQLSLDIGPALIDGITARRLLLVAAELVENAFRHAVDGGVGALAVSLRRERDAMVLVVANEAASDPRRLSSGTGLGRGIVSDLVGRAGGAIEVDHGSAGTSVRVEFPIPAGSDRHAA